MAEYCKEICSDDLEPHYTKHVKAMTAEGLHDKGDIARELARRDGHIDLLLNRVKLMEEELHRWKAIAKLRASPEWACGWIEESGRCVRLDLRRYARSRKRRLTEI